MSVESVRGCGRAESPGAELAEASPRTLAAEACRLRALAPLRRLLDGGTPDASCDQELAETCFSFGFVALGTRFAERAARALGRSADGGRARRLLLAAEEFVAVGAEAVAFERLASAHAQLGARAEAARLLVRAAACAREEGALLRAIEFCSQAAELVPASAGLHREWGLALLAANDALGARGHFERWREHEPACLEAAFWGRECALRSPTSPLPPSAHGGAGRPPLERPSARIGSDGRRRVLVLGDAVHCIAEIGGSLARWNVELTAARLTALPNTTAADETLDLLLVGLPASAELAQLRLEWLRCIPAFARIPFLGAVRLERVTLAREALRELGVVGLLDSHAKRDEVAFRVVRALGLESPVDRARVRVPVDFPVELEWQGGIAKAYAENLSHAGIRLRDARALAPNERVFVRFQLGTEALTLEGRVIHCHPAPEDGEGHVIGIFFFSIERGPKRLLEAEIDRLLGAHRAADDGAHGSSSASS